MRTNIKWLIVGIFLASAVTVWAATTHLGRLTLRETPEITGSNAETLSNATDGTWASSGVVSATTFTATTSPELTGANGETWTNTTNNIWSTAASINTTAQITVDSSPIVRTLTVPIDSLGMTDVDIPGVITLESDITILRAQVTSQDVTAGNACYVVFHSGAIRDSVSVASGEQNGANTTDYNLSAAAACSVLVSDGSAGTGGTGAMLIIQYTDKND